MILCANMQLSQRSFWCPNFIQIGYPFFLRLGPSGIIIEYQNIAIFQLFIFFIFDACCYLNDALKRFNKSEKIQENLFHLIFFPENVKKRRPLLTPLLAGPKK